MECYLHRGRSPDPWWHSHQYWQPLKESLNGQSKSWSLQWHTYCRQHFLSLCFNHATCKEKICSAVKPAFTLEAASQVLHSEWETLLWTPKHAAWQSQPSSSWRLVWEVIEPNIFQHFPKHLIVTLSFSTSCSGIYSPDETLIQPGGWWCRSNSEKQ